MAATYPVPFAFFCFQKQTECHLAGESNVEQVFSLSGQLSEDNLHPDSLADMVSTMVNKHVYKPSLTISLTSNMRCSVARIKGKKKTVGMMQFLRNVPGQVQEKLN